MNEMCLWGKYRKYYMSLFFQIILNSRCYTLRRHKRDVFDASSYNARNNNFGNPAVGHSSNTDGVHKIYNLLSLKGKSANANLDYDYMDYEGSSSNAVAAQDHFDGTHGRIHQSPDTHGSHNSDYFKDLDSAQLPPTPSGGGGGGATAIFRVRCPKGFLIRFQISISLRYSQCNSTKGLSSSLLSCLDTYTFTRLCVKQRLHTFVIL